MKYVISLRSKYNGSVIHLGCQFNSYEEAKADAEKNV